MRPKSPRLAVRAVIVHEGHVLLVNAWAGGASDLMCAPGGGVEVHASLHDNLKREVFEETGLEIDVGDVCLVNEFHDPGRAFHQVEIFFRATVASGVIDPAWEDPENIVTERRWVAQGDLDAVRLKPDALRQIAFGGSVTYDALEPIQT